MLILLAFEQLYGKVNLCQHAVKSITIQNQVQCFVLFVLVLIDEGGMSGPSRPISSEQGSDLFLFQYIGFYAICLLAVQRGSLNENFNITLDLMRTSTSKNIVMHFLGCSSFFKRIDFHCIMIYICRARRSTKKLNLFNIINTFDHSILLYFYLLYFEMLGLDSAPSSRQRIHIIFKALELDSQPSPRCLGLAAH